MDVVSVPLPGEGLIGSLDFDEPGLLLRQLWMQLGTPGPRIYESDRMPEDLPDRMSERMSDRMSK